MTTSKTTLAIVAVVGVLLGGVLGWTLKQPGVVSNPPVGGGEAHNTVEIFSEGAQLGDNVHKYVRRTLDAGDNNDFVTNRTSKTWYVNNLVVDLRGATSTTGVSQATYIFQTGTTTNANITDGNWDGTAAYRGNLIDSYRVPTGTQALFTFSAQNNGGTNGMKVIPVQPGESLAIAFNPTQGLGVAAGAANSATSTSRGLNPVWNFSYFTTQ